MILMWGKPTEFSAKAIDEDDFRDIPLPKEDSLTLTTEEGEVIEAFEEGGDIIDSLSLANKYTLEWDEYVRKDVVPAFEDEDGIVAGEHEIRIVGMDTSVPGIVIPRCVISVTQNYSVKEGYTRHYKARVLKPEVGKMIQVISRPLVTPRPPSTNPPIVSPIAEEPEDDQDEDGEKITETIE